MKAFKKKILGLSLAALMLGGIGAELPAAIKADAAKEAMFGNYFFSDYDSREEVMAANRVLNTEIANEGIVLLKNEDNALPVGDGAKISVFGKSSYQYLSGGGGSGAGGGAPVTSLYTALQDEGFQINSKLVNFYKDSYKSGNGRGQSPGIGATVPGYNTGETPIASYTDDIEASYEDYNDAAVVVFSRIGGEGFDLPRTMKWNGENYYSWGYDATELVPGARSKDDHYLQLDQNEADLLKYCGERFDKVIVLLNVGSQFECGFLDDPNHYGYHENVKAALHVGYSGMSGTVSIAKILKGEVNPSGKTVDTWARDFKKDPTWQNFGNNLVEEHHTKKGNQYANLPGSGGNGGGGYRNNYVIYKEGIYMGYRYYETRGFVEGTDAYTDDTIHGTTTSEWNDWYNAHVVYPFGYGLSYTEFNWQLISQSIPSHSELAMSDSISVTVKVTNVGDVAGKEVVQLYYTAPYDVTDAPIEKAHVVLGGYEKTDMLEPGESQELTVTLKVRDMASYDWDDINKNGFKGYELEAGNYQIKVMRNAHTEVACLDYKISEDILCETSAATGYKIENQFDDVSTYLTEELGEKYMSRSDFEGTWPTMAFRLTASDHIVEELSQWVDNKYETYVSDEGKPYYSDTMPTTGKKNGIVLSDLIGVDFDDPLWDDYMDQFTIDQMADLVNSGHYRTGMNIPELGIKSVHSSDGPAGWFFGTPGGVYSSWVNDVILASTWSKELAYKKGRAMGDEGLWGNGSAGSMIPYWYAPACNIHRSPFSGRNFEYFSEDGYISGIMAAEVIKGALDMGIVSYVKHYGVNDQETNRCGLVTWANEQSIREIYVKSFELCVTEGKTLGMMSSLNKIGTMWAGSHYGLLTELLRNEWGFHGSVVTDSYSSGWSNADLMIRAGGNLSLGGGGRPEWQLDSPTTVTALRKRIHEMMYAHANSMVMNTADYPAPPKPLSSFNATTLKAAVMNANYSASVATAIINAEMYPDATVDQVKYTLAEGTVLPEGLTLSENGIISGTPVEEASNLSIVIKATFMDYTRSTEFILNVVNSSGSILYSKDAELGYVKVNENVEIDLGGAYIYKPDQTQEDIDKYPPISYELENGCLLPEGLALSENGVLSGTPTKEGEGYVFTVVASAMGYKDKKITYTLSVYESMTFSGSTLKTGKWNESYLDKIALATSKNEVTYTLKNGSDLPKGLTLTASGYVVGIPEDAVENHKFTVVATAPYTESQEATFTISIDISFNDVYVPDAKVGQSYSTFVNTAMGASNIRYSVKSGTILPFGLILKADGTIEGTPVRAGVYKFTILATTNGKGSDELEVVLNVAEKDGGGLLGCNSFVGSTAATMGAMAVCGVLMALKEKRRKNK